jgi:hypothetical protein
MFSIANARAGVAIAEVFVASASAFMARAPAFDVLTSVEGIVEASLLAQTAAIVARDSAGGDQTTVQQPKDAAAGAINIASTTKDRAAAF